MSGSRTDTAVEATFSAGLLVSGALLLSGLLLSYEPLLRYGVMVLIGTPAAATAVLAVGLAARRDWFFVAVCLWVLCVLFSSVMVALKA